MATPTRYTPGQIEDLYRTGQWLRMSLGDVWDNNAREIPDREAVVDSHRRETWESAKWVIDNMARGMLRMGFEKDDVLVVQLPNSVELVLLRVACEKAAVLCLPVMINLRQREVERILAAVKARGMVIPLDYRGFDYHGMVAGIRERLPALEHVIVMDDGGRPLPSGRGLSGLESPLPGVGVTRSGTLPRAIPESAPPGAGGHTGPPLRPYRPDEVSMINHTSGTTGFPKFVEYPMAARLALGRGFVDTFKLTRQDTVCAMGSVPAGVNNVAYFAAPQAGARVVMLEHFEAGAAFRAIEKERVTVCCGVPAMYALMVKNEFRRDYDLSSVRLWWCGSASLPYSLAVEVEEKLGATMVNGWGAADFGGTTLADPGDSREKRILTVGRPKAGTVIRITREDGAEAAPGETGEVWGSGPAGATGYYLDPEATWRSWKCDGWFRTGDLGWTDGDGNLVISGRKKEVIIRGGQNIYPAELEGILAAHPGVAAVAAVGTPDEVMGEKVCIYVVPKPGFEPALAEIVDFLRRQDIAPYKLPERLEVVAGLPMTAGGQKVDRKALAADLARKMAVS